MTIKIVFDSFDEMMRYADRLKNGTLFDQTGKTVDEGPAQENLPEKKVEGNTNSQGRRPLHSRCLYNRLRRYHNRRSRQRSRHNSHPLHSRLLRHRMPHNRPHRWQRHQGQCRRQRMRILRMIWHVRPCS